MKQKQVRFHKTATEIPTTAAESGKVKWSKFQQHFKGKLMKISFKRDKKPKAESKHKSSAENLKKSCTEFCSGDVVHAVKCTCILIITVCIGMVIFIAQTAGL